MKGGVSWWHRAEVGVSGERRCCKHRYVTRKETRQTAKEARGQERSTELGTSRSVKKAAMRVRTVKWLEAASSLWGFLST